MLERIEKGTEDWEYLESLWDKWKERLRSHRLDMAWCSLESALVGRDAYFKLNKADNGGLVRGGAVIGDEGSLRGPSRMFRSLKFSEAGEPRR